MAEWLIEEGIGEERAILVDHGQVLAAQLQWHGQLLPGQVAEGVLASRMRGSKRGKAVFGSGEEALVDRLPPDASEGARMRFAITRSAVGEAKRKKLAQARPVQDAARPAPSLAVRVGGKAVHRFPEGMWEDVWHDAWEGTHDFTGGTLQFSATPAMTLVDVDGHLRGRDLALAACRALGTAIPRLGLGGSIGVDFPTLQAKADRKEVDGALDIALADWDHERTAMNGFGFVQMVARLEMPSLLHRLQFNRAGAAARMLLREAEAIAAPGTLLLCAHPAVVAAITQDWSQQLARKTGREVRIEADPALALQGGFAQAVPV